MPIRSFLIATGSLALALYPGSGSAQTYGTQTAWSSVMRDVLGVDVADLTPVGVGQALCALGANITDDVDYGPGQIRRIDTSGEAGYKLPGLQRVAYAFDGQRLTSIYLFRQATSKTAAVFEERFRYLSAELPLVKLEDTFAFFQGLGMQVRMQVSLSVYNGQVSEFYQGLMVSREAPAVARSPKITCSGSSRPSAISKGADDQYPTMDDAAVAGLARAWTLQESRKREENGFIYKTSNNHYSFATCPDDAATAQTNVPCYPTEPNQQLVGRYHTHPDAGSAESRAFRQYFTFEDVIFAIAEQTVSYIRSAVGIRRFDANGINELSSLEQSLMLRCAGSCSSSFLFPDWTRGEVLPR